jgi:hypothetical protein
VLALALLWCWHWWSVVMGPGIVIPPHEQLLVGLGGGSSVVAVSVRRCCSRKEKNYKHNSKESQ